LKSLTNAAEMIVILDPVTQIEVQPALHDDATEAGSVIWASRYLRLWYGQKQRVTSRGVATGRHALLTGALFDGVPVAATGAGVHRRHEHQVGRVPSAAERGMTATC